jgi:hypothetical protein
MTERNQTTGIDQAALLVALLVFSWQIVQLPGAWLPINSFIGLVLLLLIGAYSQPTSHRKLGQIWPSSHLARKIFHGRRRQTHQAYREGQEDQLGVAGPGRFTRFTRSITTKLGQIRLQIAAVAVGASIGHMPDTGLATTRSNRASYSSTGAFEDRRGRSGCVHNQRCLSSYSGASRAFELL